MAARANDGREAVPAAFCSLLTLVVVRHARFGQSVTQGVAGEAEEARGPLDEHREFLFGQRSLLEDALQERERNVL